MKYVYLLSLCLLSYNSWAQKFEFIGVVMINDTIPVAYRLNFELKGMIISGTSISDELGEYETKSIVKGSYNDGIFSFKETKTLYTKANFENLDFCYINYTGGVKLTKKKPTISGRFKGTFSDGTSCLNGTLKLKTLSEIYKKQEKILKKVRKSKKIQKKIKELGLEIPETMIRKNHVNIIKKNQNTGVFWKGDVLVMDVWDNGKIDGDVIDLFVDGKIILKNYRTSSHVRTLRIPLEKKRTEIKIISKDEGGISQTTTSIKLIDGENTNEILTSLSLYEKSIITILR